MRVRLLGGMTLGFLLVAGIAGCRSGKPGFRAETMRPDQQHNFFILYKQNCSACHGDRGMNGAAIPLNNPVYLQWAGPARLHEVIANGLPHSLMPAFGTGGGGLLTEQQVDDLVGGLMKYWSQPGMLKGVNLPAYTAAEPGNQAQGKADFQIFCARCHGSDGHGSAQGYTTETRMAAAKKGLAVGSIVDSTYLSLITTQGLRSVIVAGMPGQNMPDWRNDVKGTPMTDKQVTDIVAWLESHRVEFPGRPFSSSQSQ